LSFQQSIHWAGLSLKNHSSITSWGDAPGGEGTQKIKNAKVEIKNYKVFKHDLSMLGTSPSNQMLPNVWH